MAALVASPDVAAPEMAVELRAVWTHFDFGLS
jgi:hypothetical protein